MGSRLAKACSIAAIWSSALSSKVTEVTATQALKAFFIAAAVRAGRRSQEGAGGAQGASGLLTTNELPICGNFRPICQDHFRAHRAAGRIAWVAALLAAQRAGSRVRVVVGRGRGPRWRWAVVVVAAAGRLPLRFLPQPWESCCLVPAPLRTSLTKVSTLSAVRPLFTSAT